MRLLSAEAKIPLNHMRKGEMSDDDWNKLVPKMGQVSSAPMFIDDSPNMTMMEIRAKARRLKQRHDLKLIVIDYLQLMTSRQEGRVPPGRGLGVLPPDQAARQGARRPDRRALPAQPWPRAALRQAPDDERPARVRLDRAGRRHRDAAAPRGRLREASRPAPARPTSSWPSTATARPATSWSASRATTRASSTWPTERVAPPTHGRRLTRPGGCLSHRPGRARGRSRPRRGRAPRSRAAPGR